MSLKKALIACLLATSTLPAFANDIDTSRIFDGKPTQLAALSTQEMKETEGAWLWLAPAIGGGVASGIGYSYNNSSWNWSGFSTAVGTGALGGAMGGVGGWGVAVFGDLYAQNVIRWY